MHESICQHPVLFFLYHSNMTIVFFPLLTNDRSLQNHSHLCPSPLCCVCYYYRTYKLFEWAINVNLRKFTTRSCVFRLSMHPYLKNVWLNGCRIHWHYNSMTACSCSLLFYRNQAIVPPPNNQPEPAPEKLGRNGLYLCMYPGRFK